MLNGTHIAHGTVQFELNGRSKQPQTVGVQAVQVPLPAEPATAHAIVAGEMPAPVVEYKTFQKVADESEENATE